LYASGPVDLVRVADAVGRRDLSRTHEGALFGRHGGVPDSAPPVRSFGGRGVREVRAGSLEHPTTTAVQAHRLPRPGQVPRREADARGRGKSRDPVPAVTGDTTAASMKALPERRP